MKVVVLPHESIRPLIVAWHHSLGDSKELRDARAKILWNEFVASIVSAKGVPRDAREDKSKKPVTYWIDFPGGGMAQILVEPDRRIGWFSVERRVVVTNLNFSPGLSC